MIRSVLLAGAVMGASIMPAHAYVQAAEGAARTCFDYVAARNNTEEAVEVCTFAITSERLDTRDRASTYIHRGIIQQRRGDFTLAIADFDSAIAMDPTLAEGYVNRGTALLQNGDLQPAVAAFTAGLERGPANPAQVYYNRAVAHEYLGNVREAYEDYQRASEAAPQWDAPRTELARFQVRR